MIVTIAALAFPVITAILIVIYVCSPSNLFHLSILSRSFSLAFFLSRFLSLASYVFALTSLFSLYNFIIVDCTREKNCSGHGTCTNTGECICDAGFKGSNCSFLSSHLLLVFSLLLLFLTLARIGLMRA